MTSTAFAPSAQALTRYGHEKLNQIVTSHSIMIACQDLKGRYDAALACYEAMRRLRVFTLQDVANEANRHGFNLNPGSAQIQIGRLCRALALIMEATDHVVAACAGIPEVETIYASLLMDALRLSDRMCPDTATEFDRIQRDIDGHILYHLRPGLCRV